MFSSTPSPPCPPMARHPTGQGTPVLSHGADMLKYPVVFETSSEIRALARALILLNTTSKKSNGNICVLSDGFCGESL